MSNTQEHCLVAFRKLDSKLLNPFCGTGNTCNGSTYICNNLVLKSFPHKICDTLQKYVVYIRGLPFLYILNLIYTLKGFSFITTFLKRNKEPKLNSFVFAQSLNK